MTAISVIVPVYNVDLFIDRCVQSILNQSFKDIEIVLIDDGSTDQSSLICDEYAENYSNVFVIHQQNQGLSGARNKGIEWALKNSDSKYISFIDSDDYIDPDFYDYLYRAAEDSGQSVSICGFTSFSESIPLRQVHAYSASEYDSMDFLASHRTVATIAVNKLYDKSLWNDFRYPEGKLHEDEFTTYKVLFSAKRIVYVDIPLYFYYQRSGSIMHSYSIRRLDGVKAIEEQCEFFHSRGLANNLYSAMHTLAIGYVTNIQELIDSDHPADLVEELRKKLRYLLIKHGRRIGFPLKRNNRWIYSVAFPKTFAIGHQINTLRKNILQSANIKNKTG